MRVKAYDTTLRDGEQMKGIIYSVEDKIRVARTLASIGVQYIEAGQPGSNPKDAEVFKHLRDVDLGGSLVVAFGSTRRKGISPEYDEGLVALVNSGAGAVAVYGKSEDFQVRAVLETTYDENRRMISDSIRYLKSQPHIQTVIFDAEHFMTGYLGDKVNHLKAAPKYAMETLLAAAEAGADQLVLCDTRGALDPSQTKRVIRRVVKSLRSQLPEGVMSQIMVGYHGHNDRSYGVANAVAAVMAGAGIVQATANGWGERLGNTNLFVLIPELKLKYGVDVDCSEFLPEFPNVARRISDIANVLFDERMQYIGSNAYTHFGGAHVAAVIKDPRSYEHQKPSDTGNERNIEVPSGLSGSGTMEAILSKTLCIRKGSRQAAEILAAMKLKELEGYSYETALASFHLLAMAVLGQRKRPFEVIGGSSSSYFGTNQQAHASAVVRVNGDIRRVENTGDGQINALYRTLREAVLDYYPQIEEFRLTDFKERVVDPDNGTAAKVRVLIEMGCDGKTWTAVGVSNDQVKAGLEALLEGLEYGLLFHTR